MTVAIDATSFKFFNSLFIETCHNWVIIKFDDFLDSLKCLFAVPLCRIHMLKNKLVIDAVLIEFYF
jgi:hypothetical protein